VFLKCDKVIGYLISSSFYNGIYHTQTVGLQI